MTHDELLAKIKDTETDMCFFIRDVDICESFHKVYEALRSVVELHKPTNDGNKDICRECASLIDPWDENSYPCPTIEAIEKELE